MALPKQVEQDIKDLEDFEKNLAAQKEPPKEEPKETPKAEETPKEPEVQPKAEEKPKEPKEPQPSDDFKQKYNTLRGKYDAEVPRLHAQVKDLVQELTDIKKQLAEKAAEPKEPVKLVTDDEVEEFGEDLINVARKVAKEEFQPIIDQLKAENETLKEQITNTGNQVTEMSFEQRLAQAIPDFGVINRSPEWIAWLDEYDPMIRGPRKIAAQNAFNNSDVEAIADYVNMFKEAMAPAPADDPKPDAKEEQRKEELNRQVTPESNTSNVTPTPEDGKKRLYTAKQADKVWNDIQTALAKGDLDKANKLEAQITQAYLEGRVEVTA